MAHVFRITATIDKYVYNDEDGPQFGQTQRIADAPTRVVITTERYEHAVNILNALRA